MIECLTHKLAEAEAEIKTAVEHLQALKTGTCWCPMGIGHPSYAWHSERCLAVQALLAAADERHGHGD